MKQKDVALILVVSIISAFFSIMLSGVLFNSANDKNLTAEVVTPITPEFNRPTEKYFNVSSIDPTQIIRVTDNNNQQLFNQ